MVSIRFWMEKTHGHDYFAVLVSEDDEIIMCLHKWGAHEHPTMMKPTPSPGNGLILYFRTENMNTIRQNIEAMGYPVEKDIHLNQNSKKKEFALRDADGYYLTITGYHEYGL